MSRILCLLLIAAPLSAQREFPTRVVTDFGGLMDDPTYELNKATTVVRTGNGQFVVANGDPLEVRLYDAKGIFVRRLGRSGRGPGEYRSGALVRPWAGDSILAMSFGTRRWLLFALDGRLVREWAVDSAHPDPRGIRMQGETFTRTGTIGRRGCMLPLSSRRPLRSPWQPREALTDPAGRVWLHETDTRWQVYSPTGVLLGTMTLPHRFQVQQFSGDLILGLRHDDDGAQYVTMVQVSLPPAPAGPPPCDIPVPTGPRAREFMSSMWNVNTAGEAYESDTKAGYPTALDNTMWNGPQDADLTIRKATRDSWVVILTDKLSPLRCIVSVGPDGVPGWLNGMPACTN